MEQPFLYYKGKQVKDLTKDELIEGIEQEYIEYLHNQEFFEKWEKRKPKYCPKSGRKLFCYWCFTCKKFHKPYWILVNYSQKILGN